MNTPSPRNSLRELVLLSCKITRPFRKLKAFFRQRYYGALFCCPGKKFPRIAAGVAFSCPENIRCGRNFVVNPGCYLAAKGGIVFGDNVVISAGAKVISSGLILQDGKITRSHQHAAVHVGNDVWIGAGAIILPGVTIAGNCVIAAGAIVTKDCESGFIYAGVPAKPLRRI